WKGSYSRRRFGLCASPDGRGRTDDVPGYLLTHRRGIPRRRIPRWFGEPQQALCGAGQEQCGAGPQGQTVAATALGTESPAQAADLVPRVDLPGGVLEPRAPGGPGRPGKKGPSGLGLLLVDHQLDK